MARRAGARGAGFQTAGVKCGGSRGLQAPGQEFSTKAASATGISIEIGAGPEGPIDSHASIQEPEGSCSLRKGPHRSPNSTLLYPSENDFSISGDGARGVLRIYAYGELGSAWKAAQIGVCVVIKCERFFVCTFVTHLGVAIFVVSNNDGTSQTRIGLFRFGDSRRKNRPSHGSDSSDEIPNRPEEEPDIDFHGEACCLIVSLSNGRPVIRCSSPSAWVACFVAEPSCAGAATWALLPLPHPRR